jgi:hypothetical protein
MNNKINKILINLSTMSLLAMMVVLVGQVYAAPGPAQLQVSEGALGFTIPTLGDILTFAIRAFFVIAGLAALFYMLLGAFAWVTSGGDKDAVSAAQGKIQAAVVGVLVIVAVLAIIWTLEQGVFSGKICFGLSCPLSIPALLPQ